MPKNKRVDSDAPPDAWHAMRAGWIFQGAAQMVPWNSVLMAHGFFQQRLLYTPGASGFLVHFVIVFVSMRLLFMLCGGSLSRRYVQPLCLALYAAAANAGLLVVLAAYAVFASGIPNSGEYAMLLTLVALAALFSGFVDTGMLSLLGSFPAANAHAYVVGQGLAGVVAACLHTLAAGLQKGSPQTSVLVGGRYGGVFFGCAAFVVLASVAALYAMLRLPAFLWHYQRGLAADNARLAEIRLAAYTGISSGSAPLSARMLLRRTWDILLALLTATATSTLVVPTLLFMTQPSSMRDASVDWRAVSWRQRDLFHVGALLVASLLALAGRACSALRAFQVSDASSTLLWLALGRLALVVPVLLAGNVCVHTTGVACAPLRIRPLYTSDAVFYIVVGLSAIVGGVVIGAAVIAAPRRLKRPERPRAMAHVAYAIGIGHVLGALLSLALRELLLHQV